MAEAYICDYTRTPIGRYGGVLRDVRTDDLAALPIKALMARNTSVLIHQWPKQKNYWTLSARISP